MINILIVDDKIEKQSTIVNVIKTVCSGRNDVSIEAVSYAIDAKRFLARENVDILILDICIPNSVGDLPQENGGIQLLKEIRGAERYTYPRAVIAISEYKELTEKFELEEGMIHSSIVFSMTSDEWKIRLEEATSQILSIATQNIVRRVYDYDVAIICALPEEIRYVKKELHDVSEIKVTDDDFVYYSGWLEGTSGIIRVIISQSMHMGMVAASMLATRMIFNFAPRYIVMTGIAAGIKGKNNLGDIVCAEFAWDYGAGKEVESAGGNIHKNTIQQVSIDASISNMVRRLSSDKNLLATIKENFDGTKPSNELQIHMGPVATGAAVVANTAIVDEIKDQIRDVVAIEMEIYGVYYAAKWAINPRPSFLALKSICDFADGDKNDEYHNYASYTSAMVMLELIRNYFAYEGN